VANELNRVPESVQTADDYALSRERLSVPETIRVVTSPRRNPIAFRPSLLEPSEHHQAVPAAGGALVGVTPEQLGGAQQVQALRDRPVRKCMPGPPILLTCLSKVTHVPSMPRQKQTEVFVV